MPHSITTLGREVRLCDLQLFGRLDYRYELQDNLQLSAKCGTPSTTTWTTTSNKQKLQSHHQRQNSGFFRTHEPHLAPPLTTIAIDSKEVIRLLHNQNSSESNNEAPIFVLDDVKEDKKNSTLVNQGPNLCNMLPIMSTIECYDANLIYIYQKKEEGEDGYAELRPRDILRISRKGCGT
ncbi:hypothetical protein H5410_030714 [Solanum commersonii]|uniref:Uncharacterized protein n=1 Tax=Solanum commersonii TaxID=4109 RepID=A0A9J5YI85_SOLCO|nr:hypothetical protein H5410_030714 [Solanum commersonii]